MTRPGKHERIHIVLEETGVDEDTAAFAVSLADRRKLGDVHAVRLPLPNDEAERQTELLVEYLGFTPDEAARYVAGDQTAIQAVAARRKTEDVRADSTDVPGSALRTGD